MQPGYNPQNIMAVRTWLPVPNDPDTDPYLTAAQEATLLHEIIRRGRTLRLRHVHVCFPEPWQTTS